MNKYEQTEAFAQVDFITMNGYQKAAMENKIYGCGNAINYPILGLLGEAGEIANKYKKVLRDDKGILSNEKRKDLIDELGDVLWYVAAIADDLNITLAEVAHRNYEKLKSRRERGKISGSGDKR